jgi:hypothetical protein
VDAFAPREAPTASEQAAKKMDKVTRPSEALAAKVPTLAKQPDGPLLSVATMRERLEGRTLAVDVLETDALVGEAYTALRAVDYVSTALNRLPAAEVPLRLADLPLRAFSQQLASLFKVHVRQSVMTEAERVQWAPYDRWCLAQLHADAERAARTARNKQLKAMRTVARAWELTFRFVYNFVFVYTASLRGQTNPDTQQPWTDDERTALAQR